MKSASTFLVIIAVFIMMIAFIQSNFWNALFFVSTGALLLITTNWLYLFPRIFPYGLNGKINNHKLKKVSQLSIVFLLYLIFSSYIWHYFYTKSFGNHISIFLGFIAGSIIWTIISLARKLYLKSSKISIYQNIFAILLLIFLFKGIYISAQSQILSGDIPPNIPIYFSLVLIFWRKLMKNFKALFLYEKCKTEVRSKIIELSIWTIIGISFVFFTTFKMYKSELIVSAIGAIYLLSLPYLKKTVFPKTTAKTN